MKWNLVDRVASQVLYAVTGIVLARELPHEDFGLVGAVLIFQAFASLLVDSGFSYALIQRKRPSRLDYSTVLWFNLFMSVLLYLVLFAGAPLIAWFFRNDLRLIPLTRVICISIILNASAIVQANRLMKVMDVRMIAASNALGLIVGGVTGIALALTGFGAWAIVWQTIVTAAVKSIVLWTSSRWRPLMRFSWRSLRSYFGIGSRMMLTSFLNTLFQYIYSFFIGYKAGLGSLGYYTQSDKWSKMGVTSLTQVLTSSFLPALSAVQDDAVRYSLMVSKMNRFTAYLLFPTMFGLMLMATPVFHTLFGTKWDPSIILFQLLLLRGVFTVLNSLYTNYLLSLGFGSDIVKLEILRDTVAIIALGVTFPFLDLTAPGDPVYGIRILLWGQLVATVLTWVATLVDTVRRTRIPRGRYIADMMPYLAQTLLIVPVMWYVGYFFESAWMKLIAEAITGVVLYVGGNKFFGSRIQKEVLTYFRKGKIM